MTDADDRWQVNHDARTTEDRDVHFSRASHSDLIGVYAHALYTHVPAAPRALAPRVHVLPVEVPT